MQISNQESAISNLVLCALWPIQMTKSRIRTVLEMIKFEHSVFALPFALVGALLAARAGGDLPSWRQILWIVVAMVGARSAAMTMNRIADVEYDRRNPRTANRALPKGELSRRFCVGVHDRSLRPCWSFAAWQLNPLALKLSPVALAILFLLFLYEAIHGLVALRPRLLPRHFARGGMDRDSRLARRAHADSLRRGHALGRRLRRALRLPGRGIRPSRRAALDSEKIRHRAGALDRARDARRDGRAARFGWPGASISRGLRGLESP